MSRRRGRPFRATLALLAAGLLFLHLLPPSPVRAQDLAEGLATDGDRWFARGDVRTAARLYSALERTMGERGLPPGQAFRLAVSLSLLGRHPEAIARLQRLPPESAPGTDPAVHRAWVSWAAAGGGQEAGLALADELAQGGDARGALLVIERLHAGAAGEGGRRRAATLFGRVMGAWGTRPLVELLDARAGGDAWSPLVDDWLSGLVGGGELVAAREAADALLAASPPAPLEGILRRLRDEAGKGGESAVRVGVLLPLTGPSRVFGEAMERGVELARERFAPPGVELLVRDTRGDAETACQAAADLLEREGVVAILGPALSAEAERIIPLATARRVPVLSPGAQAPGLPASSPWFFRVALTLPSQGQAMARAAVRDLGLSPLAVFAPRDAYGRTLSRAFWDEVLALGGKVIVSAEYNLDQTDFGKELARLRGDEEVRADGGEEVFHPHFQAVYIPDTYNRVGLIAPQLAFHDIDRREALILGSSGLDAPDYIRTAEEHAEGSIFPDAFFPGRVDPAVREFVSRWRERWDEIPGTLGAQAYDAAGIVLALVRGGARDGEAVRDGLAALRDYPGVCGPTSMDAAGESVREPVFVTVFRGRLVELVLP